MRTVGSAIVGSEERPSDIRGLRNFAGAEEPSIGDPVPKAKRYKFSEVLR
jgi:hypothetical protein